MLSVVTITRNDVEGLKRTVNSTERLTMPLEHIVVDANSTDGTSEYLESMGGRIRYISEADEGRYDGMNKGARLAHGDWLWFMHSGDEFSDPKRVEEFLSLARASGARWGYGLSRVVRRGSVVAIGGDVNFRRSRFLLGASIIPHQASVVRRDVFAELGGFSLEFGLAEDQHFFVRLLELERPAVLPEFVCNFDGDGVGSMRGAWSHYVDMARARHYEGVRVTRSRLVDSLLTCGLIGKALLKASAKCLPL